MYKLIKNGVSLGTAEAPTYITEANNGCFILCSEAEATGVVYQGTAYHLLGRNPLRDAETVRLVAIDAGDVLSNAEACISALQADLATADESAISLYEALLQKDAVDAAQDDALIELYEMTGG